MPLISAVLYQKQNCLSWLILHLCCLVFYSPSRICANDIVPLPQTAALAAPGLNVAASPSILEQFSPNCTAVSHIFQSRGIAVAEIPTKPNNEMVLRYCESPSVGTCCTYSMETKMAMQSRVQLEKSSKDQIVKMVSSLSGKALKFNEVFRKLLLQSKQEFHNMFTRTYGVIYQQNSYVFSDLFNEFENYFSLGRVDLTEVMDKFFNTLYQKMFQVLNAQYSFDEKYLRCVSEHMKELKPFGDVPDKLSVQIKRSFVATRTYGQALTIAADVSKKLINVRLNADCTAALAKMQHCGACKGYAEKPCTNYCVNVIKGCLHYLNEFDIEWENFVMAMDKVAERLLGSFNIVMVVEPINIKISEAIMNFQDAGQDITNRVFQGCGRPSLGRSKRSNRSKPYLPSKTDSSFIMKRIAIQAPAEQIESDILDIDAAIDDSIILREKRTAEPSARNRPFEESQTLMTRSKGSNNRRNQRRKQQSHRKDDDDYSERDPILDKMVRDIRQRVKDSKKFWSNLPHQICTNGSSSSDIDGLCWNGHTIDRYMHSVITEHTSNPEFPGNPATSKQISQVATQLYYLKNAISYLRNAYNGQDVDWRDQEEPYFGSGSGSGGGTDDEDDDDGSGLGISFTPNHKSDRTDDPSIHRNNVDDEDDTDVDVTGTIVTHTTHPKHTNTGGISVGGGQGGVLINEKDLNNVDFEDSDDINKIENKENKSNSSNSSTASKPNKMSLRRALLLYLLPLYMAWFGGICSDFL